MDTFVTLVLNRLFIAVAAASMTFIATEFPGVHNQICTQPEIEGVNQ